MEGMGVHRPPRFSLAVPISDESMEELMRPLVSSLPDLSSVSSASMSESSLDDLYMLVKDVAMYAKHTHTFTHIRTPTHTYTTHDPLPPIHPYSELLDRHQRHPKTIPRICMVLPHHRQLACVPATRVRQLMIWLEISTYRKYKPFRFV